MYRSRRILLTLVGAFVAVVLTASAAGAATEVTGTDRAGDGLGPGDIRAVRLRQSGADFSVRVRTEKPLNLDTAPAWQNEGTRSILRVYLDTVSSASGPEYVVVIDNVNGFLEVDLRGLAAWRPRAGCDPVLTQPQLVQIQVNVGLGCFSTDAGVRAYAAYRYDKRGDGTLNSTDRAPNAGFGPQLSLAP
jgi:hypothetical protein